MSLKLYYSPGACSLAPHIALEETGEPFEPVLVKLADGAQRKPDYLEINPKGRVPAIADDGFVVTENPAVLRYIARKYPTADALARRHAGRRALHRMAGLVHIRPSTSPTRMSGARSAMPVERDRQGRGGREGASRCPGRCGKPWKRNSLNPPRPWAAGERYSVADPYVFTFWTWGRGAERSATTWPATSRPGPPMPGAWASARPCAAHSSARASLCPDLSIPPGTILPPCHFVVQADIGGHRHDSACLSVSAFALVAALASGGAEAKGLPQGCGSRRGRRPFRRRWPFRVLGRRGGLCLVGRHQAAIKSDREAQQQGQPAPR